MHGHFEDNLGFKELILEKKPKHIVECGAGTGELTRKLQTLYNIYDVKITVISDNTVKDIDPRINFIKGISYMELAKFQDESIDFCIIDTDHNYWTLMNELSVVDSKMANKGFIAMHDVSYFYHNSGLALSYAGGIPYPEQQIQKFMFSHGGIGDALIDFLSFKRFDYKMLAFTSAHMGAAIIQKEITNEVIVAKSGNKPVFVGENQC